MGVLGQAIREYDHSAFEHYEYVSLDEPGYYVRVKGCDMEFWYWSAGQEGDVCVKCEKDISDVSDILLKTDGPRFVVMCQACADLHLHSSIVRY